MADYWYKSKNEEDRTIITLHSSIGSSNGIGVVLALWGVDANHRILQGFEINGYQGKGLSYALLLLSIKETMKHPPVMVIEIPDANEELIPVLRKLSYSESGYVKQHGKEKAKFTINNPQQALAALHNKCTLKSIALIPYPRSNDKCVIL